MLSGRTQSRFYRRGLLRRRRGVGRRRTTPSVPPLKSNRVPSGAGSG